MDQNEQIQLAFEICDRISRLESALWDLYFDEFMDIIINEEDKNHHQQHDDELF